MGKSLLGLVHVALFFQLLIVIRPAQASSTVEIHDPVSRFIFASCNREHLAQPLWPSIIAMQPQFFMWAGDNIYANSPDPKVMRDKYQVQLNHPVYSQLIQSIPVIGTWDDHDYGNDNEGKNWVIKDLAKEYFLDFIGEPQNTLRRRQSGIHTSYTMGPIGQQIKILLLDTRFNKEDVNSRHDDILGDEQWAWLANELHDSSAQAHFIVSSFSVLSPSLLGAEQWIDYTVAIDRLNALITNAKPKGLIILTGDRHFGGMLTRKLQDGFTYYELMSSGMTHVSKAILRPILRNVYGSENTLFEKNFGVIDLHWGTGSDPLQLTFSLHTDSSTTIPAWQRQFNLRNNHWELKE